MSYASEIRWIYVYRFLEKFMEKGVVHPGNEINGLMTRNQHHATS